MKKAKYMKKKSSVAMVPNTPRTIVFKNGAKFIIKDQPKPIFPMPRKARIV